MIRAATREEAAGEAAVETVNEEVFEKVSEEESEKETTNVVVPTVKVAETANKVEAKETTVAEEAVVNKEGLKSKSNVAGSTTNPGIDVDDEFCRNDSFEAKSSSDLSYFCAAAASAAVPKRKLAGFDYLSMKMSDSE